MPRAHTIIANGDSSGTLRINKNKTVRIEAIEDEDEGDRVIGFDWSNFPPAAVGDVFDFLRNAEAGAEIRIYPNGDR